MNNRILKIFRNKKQELDSFIETHEVKNDQYEFTYDLDSKVIGDFVSQLLLNTIIEVTEKE